MDSNNVPLTKNEVTTLVPSSVAENSSISRNLEEKKTQQPTRQPTNKFVAPSVPEDVVTKSPVPTTVPTKGGTTATTPTKTVTSTIAKPSGTMKDSLSPTLKPTMSMENKIIVPTHIPGTATADDKTIGGAVNVNAEIKSETKTALNSARYFMYTFVGALGCFALVFFLKRCVFVSKSVRVLIVFFLTFALPLPSYVMSMLKTNQRFFLFSLLFSLLDEQRGA